MLIMIVLAIGVIFLELAIWYVRIQQQAIRNRELYEILAKYEMLVKYAEQKK